MKCIPSWIYKWLGADSRGVAWRIGCRLASRLVENIPLVPRPVVGRSGIFGNTALPLATFGTAVGGITNVEPGRDFQFLVRLRF